MPEAKPQYPLINEVWGGFAATLVALPAAIGYGVAVYGGLGAEYVGYGVRAGLIGAIVLGFVTAAIGGAPRLISAPSAPAAAILASVAATLSAAQSSQVPERVLMLLGIMVLIAGALQALYGALGGGRLIKFIPYPVVAGYLSAVAVMILLQQLPRFLGVGAKSSGWQVLFSPAAWQWSAITVGTTTILGMVFLPRVIRRIPAAILGLACGVATYFVLALGHAALLRTVGNPLVLGDVAPGDIVGAQGAEAMLRALRQVGWDDIASLLAPAVALSILLSVDSLKTCVIVDALTFGRHGSNRTLLGQGAGNCMAALLGGMPGSGTMGATLVNIESGGRTRASGALEGAFVLLAVLVFGRWIAWVPLASLAGILIVVACRMVDVQSLRLVRQRSTVLDFLVVATVIAVAVTTNLMAAAGAGVALAMLLFIRDQIRGSVLRRKTHGGQTSSKQHRLPTEQAILDRFGTETTICELQGSLFFGTTDQLYRELETDLKTSRFLILDLRRVQSLDYTARHLFAQFDALLRQHGGSLLFSRVPARPELRDYLSTTPSAEDGPGPRTFATLDDALQWAEDRILAEHLPERIDTAAPLALREFELFRGVTDIAALSALAASVTERHLGAGEVVFQAGDSSDALYLVRRGIVRVMLPLKGSGYHTLATFGRGTFFGEMAFLVHGTRSANAVATTEADVYLVTRARFDAVVRAHPTVGEQVFEQLAYTLAVRLRHADSELRAFYET
ncbi:SulP family inorganic anion transporter [Opitutus sp. ER46]|uniref:SLC26A/SulP transporter family protein n=1 Tax=Opitutus sp. ER46 TaxID=2161864 RepID=UPI001304E948|nr:SulP family inorganic anion transporter [Opitutus sp. ER46]